MIQTLCTTCRFWRHEQPGPTGLCVRYAPAPVNRNHYGAPLHDAMWPITWSENWCGEWEAKQP